MKYLLKVHLKKCYANYTGAGLRFRPELKENVFLILDGRRRPASLIPNLPNGLPHCAKKGKLGVISTTAVD